MLVAVGIDSLFGDVMDDLACSTPGIAPMHAAPVKSFGRMAGKLQASDDHRYVKKLPRPAMNIDIVRRLAVAKHPQAARAFISAVSKRFGGLSYVKCLPDLIESDPAAAATRYHMLPVMLTVLYAPEGLTVSSLATDPEVVAMWSKLRKSHPGSVSGEQWKLDHDAAIAVLANCGHAPVAMHCEVQLVLEPIAEIRHGMHEVYKVFRAESGTQLHADLAKPDPDRKETDLLYASGKGKITSVLALLKGLNASPNSQGSNSISPAVEGGVGTLTTKRKGARGLVRNTRRIGDLKVAAAAAAAAAHGHTATQHSSSGSGHSSGNRDLDVNRRRATRGGATAIFLAAQSGHLSVVLALLDAGADPSIGTTTHNTTPILIAASNGYLAVVRALLGAGAEPSAATTDGWTPLYVAAQKGHLDVVQALLHGGAECSKAKPSNGCTPLYIAAQEGFVSIVQALVDAGANPALPRSNGTTPLTVAEKQGHLECVRVIRAATAKWPSTSTTA